MNAFKRATTNIKRQPVKSGLLLVLIFILGTVISAAIATRTAIVVTEENMMMKLPAVATLEVDHLTAITELELGPWDQSVWSTNRPTEMDISAVGNLPYIRAFDFYSRPSFFSTELQWAPLQFDETRIQGLDNYAINQIRYGTPSQGRHQSIFTVRGVYNPDITDIEAGLITLTQGRTFTAEEIESHHQVAVISQEFATINHLYIGAEFTLESLVGNIAKLNREGIFDWAYRFDEPFLIHEEIIEFQVIGIFDIDLEIDYDLLTGWEMFDYLQKLSMLNNHIYIPVTVANEVMRNAHAAELEIADELEEMFAAGGWDGSHLEETPRIDAIFLLYDPRMLEDFMEAAELLLPDFWGVVDTSGAFGSVIASMDTMLDMADFILLFAVGATIVTLILTLTLLLRERRTEIGIYMALGDKKSKILSQFLTEIFMITTLGLMFALFTGNLLSHTISQNMLETTLLEQMESETDPTMIPWELTLFNPGNMTVEEVTDLYDTSLNAQTILLFVGVSFVVTLVATIFPVWYVMKLEPKKVLL